MENFQFFFIGLFSPIFAEIRRNSKIGLHYVLRHIPISVHAKFQGNRTIRLGEKREHTETHTHRQTDRQT